MQVSVIVLLVIPLLVLIGVTYIWKRKYTSRNTSPLKGKLLRAPGEYLMEERGYMFEKIALAAGLILFSPSFIVANMTVMDITESPKFSRAVIGYGIICISALFWLWKLLTDVSRYDLGLRGERAVAEELNKLMRWGYHVYHDFEKDTGGNIDHVVVSPSGVYCVETKCRRKVKGKKGQQIKFDGERLLPPFDPRKCPIIQTNGHVYELSKWLKKALGEEVTVKGILTFPGWSVEDKTRKNGAHEKEKLHALNPGQIWGTYRKPKRRGAG